MAGGIVAQYIREGSIRERPRGGRNNVQVDHEMRQRLEDIISEKCVVTLSQITGELRRRLPAKPLIHDRAAAQSWEGMLFPVKLVRPVPADRNRRCFAKRQEYGNWFANHAIMHQCVFIDDVVTTCGLPGITGGRGSLSVHKTSMQPARTERDRSPSSIVR